MIVKLDPIADPARLSVSDGEKLTLLIPENPTTGYVWEARGEAGAVLEEVGSSFIPPSGDALGAGGIRSFHYRARKPGSALLDFVLEFATGPTDRDQHCKVEVEVRPTPEI